MPQSNFDFKIDEVRRLLIVRPIGREPSAWYTERMLAAYETVEAPWQYNRLIDHRRFRGMIDFSDLQRIAAWWDTTMTGRGETPRVAMLTRQPLTQARIGGANGVFSPAHFRYFTSHDDALAWLSGAEELPSAAE